MPSSSGGTPIPPRFPSSARRNAVLLALALAGWAAQSQAESPPAAPVSPAPGAAPAEAEPQPVFDVMDFQIDGNTVLDVEKVETAVIPFLGPGKTIDDVEKARQSLEMAYRDAGYPTVSVDIPEQDVENGVVRFRVVEGSVESLTVSGSRYYSLGKIRDGVPTLAEGQVPYMPAVQEQVGKLAQESADRTLTPIFRAGETPGKTEVELRVKDVLPLHGSVEVNSRNNEETTRTRLVASIRYDNLWQRFHSASLQFQTAPENYDELEVWSGTYVMPTGLSDTRLALYGIGISSNTQLGASVGGANVVGSGSIYGARLVKPLPGSGSFFHSATAGFDYKSFDQAVTLVGQDTGRTPIDYGVFMLGYDATLRGEQSVTSLGGAVHFGFRGLGNDLAEFENKRFNANPGFLYFTADVKHQQVLPYDLRLIAKGAAQASESPLISNEQFAVGGPQSVRGYHQTQQLGDHGVNLSLELHSPRLLPDDWDWAQDFRLLGFGDWAYLWILDPLKGTPSHYRLASAGMGLRMQILKHFTGELDWAYPFYAQSTVGVGEQRVDFRVAYEF